MMQPTEEDNARATALRAMAQHVVLLALLRTHPEPARLRDFVEQFAEATRAQLLASDWTDAQLATFDQALGVLVNTLPPPSATQSQEEP